MKKNLFFKFFVLVAMALFTITACQNEDAIVNETGDLSQAEYTAMLNALKSKIDNAVNAQVKTLTATLNADKASFSAGSANEATQKRIIGNAIQIEALNAFKSRAAGTLRAGGDDDDPPVCALEELEELINDDFFNQTVVTDVSWFLSILVEKKDITLVKKDNLMAKFNAFLSAAKTCNLITNAEIVALQDDLVALTTIVETHIDLITGLLDIQDGGDGVFYSKVLKDLQDGKADKFELNEKLYNLKDVYDELIEITDALDVRLTQAEEDIKDLQERVAYIEEVEIPAIWDALSFLYEYIGDVYDNLDHRVAGLTFKPENDFGPGLSSLILVRGLSEWEAKTVEGGFGWQPKASGSVYKGVTWLTYNVSPANAEIDFSTLELVYTTTTLITRSNSEDLLKIYDGPQEELYAVSYENGLLRVPVLVNQDLYDQSELPTSFDANAKESIKVALRLKNRGYTAGDLPTRPEKEDPTDPVEGLRSGDAEERSVVSSEYVTVWFGLFDGAIAKKDASKADQIGVLFPTEIITADFLKKDCSNADYPVVTLWVGDGKPNTVTIADSVLAVIYDQFEKKFFTPESKNFNDHILSYELVDLGNNANNLVTFNGANGKIEVNSTNRPKATGKTLAVLVKAKVGDAVHALGYVRVIIAGPEKELITITNNLSLNPINPNCNAWSEFTVRNTVSTFINSNIVNKSEVNKKTNITTTPAFYQKYTEIEINSVAVTNSTATLPELTQEELKALINFEYVTSGTSYIRGTVSNMAPLGEYTVVTTLSSEEYIPDLQVTWKFSLRVPQLKPSYLLVNGQFIVSLPSASPLITASYTGSLNSAFLQQNGQFDYSNLSPNGTACPDFITPYFIFKEVPAGYTISEEGTTVSKEGVEAAVIVEENGEFSIKLIEGAAAHGLVGNNTLKVEAKGIINEGIYVTYRAFNVYFKPPLNLVFPTNASFRNNQYSFNLYAVGASGADVIRAWDGLTVPMKNNKEHAKLMIDYYGINYLFDQSYEYAGRRLGSPMKLDLENITYASGSSNSFNSQLSDLGPTVTVLQFTANDVEQYYNITTTPIRYKLRFNANGASLPGNLRISIPVVMEHRWGYTVENLVIRVN